MPDRSRRPSPGTGTARRRRAEGWGNTAERIVELILRARGWRVLARRFETHSGEIDLVVRRGGTVAFVEVKAREDLAGAAEAVDVRSRRRIVRAAMLFMQKHPALAGCDQRFDVALVRRWRWPVIITDAFRADD
ncbi:YraN family protein [Methylobrevis albus]|uniref:UPF0102 protein I5731_06185 n=1 Tax=Methylobrevis albus TaxID=2793297 RepID=A0A931I119_9HYPH|nr:YraN family protein [Methylobrevis albus]MBH0237404.1 YraN family protein [Methylobrevis albus]